MTLEAPPHVHNPGNTWKIHIPALNTHMSVGGRETALSLNITSLPRALCNQSRQEMDWIGHLVTNFDWTVQSY